MLKLKYRFLTIQEKTHQSKNRLEKKKKNQERKSQLVLTVPPDLLSLSQGSQMTHTHTS